MTLYDRGSLAAALGAAGEEGRLSDRQLLLRAFRRWGEDCFGKLNGDFAIALFDERANRIYLARDHAGLRPLHYRIDSQGLDFSSMPLGLARLDGSAPAPDWDRWLQYHAATPQIGPQSFLENVDRVEPAQVVAIEPGQVRKWRHWSPPADTIDLPYPDIVEAVSETLRAATADRRRGGGKIVAAQLSSGLDSSAVLSFAAADGHPILALTGVPTPGDYSHLAYPLIADEGDVAAATAALYPSVQHRRLCAPIRPLLDAADHLHRMAEQPQRVLYNYGWVAECFAEASAAGAKVLLTGNRGNMFFSPFGTHAFSELLIQKRFREWGRLAVQHMRETPVRLSGIIGHSLPAFLPSSLFRAAMWARGHAPPDNFQDSYLNLKNERVRDLRQLARRNGWLNSEPEPDGRQVSINALTWDDAGPVAYGLRRHYGVEERDPTCDRRLLEITLALPSKYFIHEGRPRSLAKDVLKGRVAGATIDGIRGRQGQDWPLAYALSRAAFAEEIAAIRAHPMLSGLIAVDALERDDGRFDTDEHRHHKNARYRPVMRTLGMTRFARTIGNE